MAGHDGDAVTDEVDDLDGRVLPGDPDVSGPVPGRDGLDALGAGDGVGLELVEETVEGRVGIVPRGAGQVGDRRVQDGVVVAADLFEPPGQEGEHAVRSQQVVGGGGAVGADASGELVGLGLIGTIVVRRGEDGAESTGEGSGRDGGVCGAEVVGHVPDAIDDFARALPAAWYSSHLAASERGSPGSLQLREKPHMFDGRFRTSFEKGLRPVGVSLRRAGIKADHLTAFGGVMSGAAAVAIANGALRGGLLLLALTAIPDVLDGAVAKASGTASPRGAFFDSVMDRVADALLLGGVAWYLDTTEPGRIALLPMAVLGASLLISYERAKAESLGFDARGGLMERAERLVLLALALLFDSLLIPALWLMLVLTLITAGQRFVKVWRQASATVPQPSSSDRDRRRRTLRRVERQQRAARRRRRTRP